KPGLGKVWALRIKKGCASILTQPLFSFNALRHLWSYYIKKTSHEFISLHGMFFYVERVIS
ncbi:hypothetical protein, partial [Bacteroides cellulosilyticus]